MTVIKTMTFDEFEPWSGGADWFFEIVSELPTPGTVYPFSDGWTYGTPQTAQLDPEQRTGDDAEHYRYTFYTLPVFDADGKELSPDYVAIELPLYRVYARRVEYSFVEVYAEDERTARELADGMELEDFTIDDMAGKWDILPPELIER